MPNTEKPRLVILDVDRPLTAKEHPVRDIFLNPSIKTDVVIFFYEEKNNTPCRIEVVLKNISRSLKDDMQELFPDVEIEDYEDDYTDFSLRDVAKDTFIEIVSNRYEVQVKLFSVEKPLPREITPMQQVVIKCSNGHDFLQQHILMQDKLVKRGRNGDIMRERDYICPVCKIKIDTRDVVWENAK